MESTISLSDLIPGGYVACKYDENWWLGNICEISEEEQDVKVKFMHPHGPARTYSWPRKEDECWVPLMHIITSIDAPLTSTGQRIKRLIQTFELY